MLMAQSSGEQSLRLRNPAATFESTEGSGAGGAGGAGGEVEAGTIVVEVEVADVDIVDAEGIGKIDGSIGFFLSFKTASPSRADLPFFDQFPSQCKGKDV